MLPTSSIVFRPRGMSKGKGDLIGKIFDRHPRNRYGWYDVTVAEVCDGL